MRPTSVQYAQALSELSSEAKAEDIVTSFLTYLSRRGETKKLPSIVKELERMDEKKTGEIRVSVVTASELTAETKKTLTEKAKRLFPQKKPKLSFTVDRSLLGGALFRTDETIFDATLLRELQSLKKAITKA